MVRSYLPLLITLLFSFVGVLGDFFLKLAATGKVVNLKWFILGLLVYSSTAFGWFYVMKYVKLSTLGVVYSMCIILFLTGLGVFYFKESLNFYEVIGIITALISLILLGRFA